MTGDEAPGLPTGRDVEARIGTRATALIVGILAVLASLTPSLLPRPALLQGALAALSFLLGYLAGVLLYRLACRVREVVRSRMPRQGPARFNDLADGAARFARRLLPRRRALRIILAVTGIAIGANAVAGAAVANQNEVRAAVEMPPLDGVAYGALLLAFIVVTALGFGVAAACRSLARTLTRVAGPRRGIVLTAAAVAVVAVVVGGGVVATVDRVYAERNAAADGVSAPTASTRSGSPGSVVEWQTLGRHGAAFVAGGPRAADIAALTGGAALDPVRVYVGLTSAPTLDERVALAVDELHRTGAFERDVLVVATTTGSGWLEPQTVDAIEYLHAGDTAIVAIQYAYTPSWVSFLFDPDAPIGSARALFAAVEAEVAALPAGDRPRLVSYGLSLGAHGSQAVFADLDDVRARTDGALFVGSPNGSVMWRHLQATRDAGSPAWQPVRDAGRQVRWISLPADLASLAGPWEDPRVLYLQHPTDPVTWLGPQLLWQSPEWLRAEQRGPGISPAMTWFPVITGLQVTVDMLMGESVPARYGHNYGDVVVDGWRAVTGDAGLSDAALDSVRAEIASYPYRDEND
ncbi:MAG: alpha/beta-hydrolase family protein [Microcella sp.]